MTKPKGTNKKIRAFCFAHFRKEKLPMSRKKKLQTLLELYAANEATENELKKAKQK